MCFVSYQSHKKIPVPFHSVPRILWNKFNDQIFNLNSTQLPPPAFIHPQNPRWQGNEASPNPSSIMPCSPGNSPAPQLVPSQPSQPTTLIIVIISHHFTWIAAILLQFPSHCCWSMHMWHWPVIITSTSILACTIFRPSSDKVAIIRSKSRLQKPHLLSLDYSWAFLSGFE